MSKKNRKAVTAPVTPVTPPVVTQPAPVTQPVDNAARLVAECDMLQSEYNALASLPTDTPGRAKGLKRVRRLLRARTHYISRPSTHVVPWATRTTAAHVVTKPINAA